MKTRAMYLLASVAGPVLVLAGLAGMLGFGIPSPYWLAAVLFGAVLILFGQRGLKQTQPVGDLGDPSNLVLTKKRHRFWIFVAIASSVYAAGSFWFPLTTPEMRANLCWAIMLMSFGLVVGIFLYSLFTKKKP
jgi:apolipoprotein N-acyltransferase